MIYCSKLSFSLKVNKTVSLTFNSSQALLLTTENWTLHDSNINKR